MSIAVDIHKIALEAQSINANLNDIGAQLKRIADALNPVPSDVKLKASFKEFVMASSKKPLVVKMKATKGGMKAVGDPVHWSAASQAGGILLQVTDAQGNDLPNPAVTDVTSTMSSDNNTLATVAKTDELDYTISKLQTPTSPAPTITLSATLTYNAGTPGPFSASLPIICDVAAPGDLKIKFTQA